MTEKDKDLEKLLEADKELDENSCGDGKKIDDYLRNTICELPEEENKELPQPTSDKFEVDSPEKPKKVTPDPYEGML